LAIILRFVFFRFFLYKEKKTPLMFMNPATWSKSTFGDKKKSFELIQHKDRVWVLGFGV